MTHYDPATNLGYVDPTGPFVTLVPALSGHPNDSLANYVGPGGSQNTASGLLSTFDLKNYGGTATVTGRLSDAASLKSITAYTRTDYDNTIDLDGTPYDIIDLLAFPIRANQFSQELQVYGQESHLKWIGGAYYFRENGSQISEAAVLTVFSPTPGFNPQGPDPATNTSYSAFAEADYEFLPRLSFKAGARYVIDKREITYHDHTATGTSPPGTYGVCTLANDPFDPNPANCTYNSSVEYHYIPWTTGFEFQATDDVLAYLKVAKGFRSGAYALTGPQAVPPGSGVSPADAAIATAFALRTFAPVAPENLISYELGAKTEFLDHRLRMDGAAYWSRYANIQLNVNLPAACPTCTPNSALENTGTANIWGGEFEVTALIEKLKLDASVGYANPKYVKGPLVGTDVINVSKLNYAFGANYPINTSAGTLTLNADYSYRSKAEYFAISPGLPAASKDSLVQQGFGLVDARAAFELSSIPLTIAVYGQNLANKAFFNSASSFAPPLGYNENQAAPPRTYGVSLHYNY